MRIDELKNVTWNDLRKKTETDPLICKVDGKVGKREIVIQNNAEVYFETLYEFRKDFLGETPNSNEVIFINYKTN